MNEKFKLIEIRKQLSKLLFKFEEEVSNEGITLIWDGELMEGIDMYTYDADGNKVAIADGMYTLPGKTIEIAGGKIAKLTVVEEEATVVEENKEIMTENLFDKEAFDNSMSDINSKIDKLSEAILKINEVVLAFGEEKDDNSKPNKKVAVNDYKAPVVDASKYFGKK